MSLRLIAKRRARKAFPSPREKPEHAAYAQGFIAGHGLAIERILWVCMLIVSAACGLAWLFRGALS